MKKEEIRREFFKLKHKGHSYSQCRKLLRAKCSYEVTIRTLKRWNKKLERGDWDLRDHSRRPNNILSKITPKIEENVVKLRKKTGWGERKIADSVELGHSTVNRILNKHKLCRDTKLKKRRIKWVRWQRKNPNSLWQIDHSDQKVEDKWLLSALDDCSRYSLALISLSRVTTDVVIKILDELIEIHGKPREILTDNGSAYGLKSKHSKFDRWCKKRGIKHIRTSVHSPQTTGKVERLFQTFKHEIEFCNNDSELFRMRYNHFRPHLSLKRKTPSELYFRW